jgi:hypothetical protein
MTITTQLDQLCINTLRMLSIDVVQQAQSGHPGTPMDAAPTVYCLTPVRLMYWLKMPDKSITTNGRLQEAAMLPVTDFRHPWVRWRTDNLTRNTNNKSVDKTV